MGFNSAFKGLNDQTALAVLGLDFGLPKYVLDTADLTFVTVT